MEHNDESTAPAKLFRSKSNRVIGGVCGGIAEYFNIDPLIVRIAWVFVALFGGAGIIAYIISLIIIPENPNQESVKIENGFGPTSAPMWPVMWSRGPSW